MDIRHYQYEVLEKLQVQLFTMRLIKEAVQEFAEEETVKESHENMIMIAFNLDHLPDTRKVEKTIGENDRQVGIQTISAILAPKPVIENKTEKDVNIDVQSKAIDLVQIIRVDIGVQTEDSITREPTVKKKKTAGKRLRNSFRRLRLFSGFLRPKSTRNAI